jgi:hypothetical protein
VEGVPRAGLLRNDAGAVLLDPDADVAIAAARSGGPAGATGSAQHHDVREDKLLVPV